jgi:hypothetical protein
MMAGCCSTVTLVFASARTLKTVSDVYYKWGALLTGQRVYNELVVGEELELAALAVVVLEIEEEDDPWLLLFELDDIAEVCVGVEENDDWLELEEDDNLLLVVDCVEEVCVVLKEVIEENDNWLELLGREKGICLLLEGVGNCGGGVFIEDWMEQVGVKVTYRVEVEDVAVMVTVWVEAQTFEVVVEITTQLHALVVWELVEVFEADEVVFVDFVVVKTFVFKVVDTEIFDVVFLLYHGNVSSSQPYVSREQRAFAQARLTPGSTPAQLCSSYLQLCDEAQSRLISLEIINFERRTWKGSQAKSGDRSSDRRGLIWSGGAYFGYLILSRQIYNISFEVA